MRKLLRTASAALVLVALFCGCQSGKYLVADAKNSACYLSYDLASESRLRISSPELNRQLHQNRQVEGDPFLHLSQEAEAETLPVPRDLKFAYSNPARGDKSELKLYFDEESWQLDRALFDIDVQARTWLLEFDAKLEREPAEDGGFGLDLETELTTLLWSVEDRLILRQEQGRPPTLLAPPQFSARQLARATGARTGDILETLAQAGIPASPDGAVDRELWQQVGGSLGIRVTPQDNLHQGFQKLTLGRSSDELQRMNYSLGTFLPARLGELVATYRLLHRAGEQSSFWSWDGGEEFYEHALALAYTGHFEGPVRIISNTLSAYRYNGMEAGDGEEFYGKVENRLQFSWGSEPPWGLKSLVSEYRFDLGLITQNLFAFSDAYAPAGDELEPGWESQLRLKTEIGTLYGRYRFADFSRRTSFGLEKRGQGNSLFKLYCKDVNHLREGAGETIIGGGIDLPLHDDFWGFLALQHWKFPEKNLFPRTPLLAFTSPRQGRHVSTLDGSAPGVTR